MASKKVGVFDGDAYVDGIRAQLDRSSLVPADWVVKNFKHPKNDRIPWSFEDHEFQIEIVNQGDDVPVVWTKKCAQVGLSTLQIVSLLTFCATHEFLKIAYVLPTAKFATEFSAMRMTPMILASPVISGMVSSDTDNTGTKKIGSCFMIMRGTSGEAQAISVDLDCLVIDEVNFCNQKVLSAFSSRLQHSLLKLRRIFSTPTIPKYGVSAGFDTSTQAFRAVHCDHCSTWVLPDFFNDVVIPGFEKPVNLYRKGDHEHPGVKEAYLSCPSCRGKLTIDNLNNPDKREWVHLYPDRLEKGYQVYPWDVPKYNPIPDVLYSIKDYTYQDWNNFRLGVDHESAENSFVLETVKRNAVIPPISLERLLRGEVHGVFIGCDLGKTNHLMVGIPNSQLGTLDIITLARPDIEYLQQYSEAGTLGVFLKDLFLKTWGIRSVIDHAPSWEPALFLHQQLPEGKAFGAYYVQAQKGKLDIYQFNEKTGAVNIDRNAHFDDVVAAVNGGKVRFPLIDTHEMSVLLEHLSVMKKIQQINSKGQVEEVWTSTSSEDHFSHALGYLWCAYSSVEERFTTSALILPPMASRIKLK